MELPVMERLVMRPVLRKESSDISYLRIATLSCGRAKCLNPMLARIGFPI